MLYTTRLAFPEDEAAIIEVEVAASALFLTAGFPPLTGPLDHLSPATVQQGVRESRLWVAENGANKVIGFALAGTVDDNAHLFEIDVHPDHGRQGIGRRLIHQVEAWARAQQHAMLTLTTFCTVPWNGPFYRRLGFHDLTTTQMGMDLSAMLRTEIAENTVDWMRCAMGKRL
ncbi:MAG: GNAT family N-acetyltransferase [Bacteroidota bacterium]